MLHPDLYTKEAELINTCKRRLCDGKDIDDITKVRLMCLSRGATGLLELTRSFRKLDDDGNNMLGIVAFQKGLRDIGLKLDEKGEQALFNSLDENGEGFINLNEFIEKIRPPMSDIRTSIIDKAFERMDSNNDGVITVDDIRRVYSMKYHPKYLSGERSADEILNEFLHVFEQRGVVDGRITKEDFVNYYAALSASIDKDAYFDLALRKAYNI